MTSRSAPWSPRLTSTRTAVSFSMQAPKGIRAALGGTPADGPVYFVHPTVLIDVPERAECSREEIFGRVVTVETFTAESEAIARAKDMPYGLAASVWTETPDAATDLPTQLHFGTRLGQLPPSSSQR